MKKKIIAIVYISSFMGISNAHADTCPAGQGTAVEVNATTQVVTYSCVTLPPPQPLPIIPQTPTLTKKQNKAAQAANTPTPQPSASTNTVTPNPQPSASATPVIPTVAPTSNSLLAFIQQLINFLTSMLRQMGM
jgi:hypothetical protein